MSWKLTELHDTFASFRLWQKIRIPSRKSISKIWKPSPIPSHRNWRLSQSLRWKPMCGQFIQSGCVVLFEYINSLKQIATALGRVVLVAVVPNLSVAFSSMSGWLHARGCKHVSEVFAVAELTTKSRAESICQKYFLSWHRKHLSWHSVWKAL